MKLLIVDDEKITRDGLMNSIDWKTLGISAVCQADDGVHGYETALTFHPDIVLSDIRMPRMSGIEMAEKIQRSNPDISVIFMSGYSDKEYLKAAIKLKAVSYVEKPINIEEICDAVADACKEVQRNHENSSSKALSLSHSRQALAVKLSQPSKADDKSLQLDQLNFDFPLNGTTLFFSFLIQFYNNVLSQETLDAQISPLIQNILTNSGLHEIHALRHGHLFLFHVWGFREFTDNQKNYLGEQLEETLDSLPFKYHIVFGKNVQGALSICNSYNSAVIELQHSFFSRENSHRIYRHQDQYDAFFDLSTLDFGPSLSESMLRKDKIQVNALLESLFENIMSHQNVLPNQVKDLYYKLLTIVRDTYRVLQIQTSDTKEPDDSIWGHISDCESIYELHDLILERVHLFFEMAQNHTKNNSTVYLIKEFIGQNYQNEALSIKDINEHVYLSTSYICTLFKNETGQTLNQYLTDFRIEKAKKLLSDPRNKISDISSKVGYSDGNYFGKIFKKMVGISPSEYREQEIK